jgi:hypothetical protein
MYNIRYDFIYDHDIKYYSIISYQSTNFIMSGYMITTYWWVDDTIIYINHNNDEWYHSGGYI